MLAILPLEWDAIKVALIEALRPLAAGDDRRKEEALPAAKVRHDRRTAAAFAADEHKLVDGVRGDASILDLAHVATDVILLDGDKVLCARGAHLRKGGVAVDMQ